MEKYIKDLKFFYHSTKTNLNGFRTKRKLIVIESDDWGGIRMPNKKVYDKLLKFGIKVDKCPYCRFDTLAGKDDLEALFTMLTEFKDFRGNSPVITANVNTSNPDFNAIRDSKFELLITEPFTKTIESYYPNHRVFELWQEGISRGIFFVQNHHILHVNPSLWLKLLKQGNDHLLKAFELYSYGLSFATSPYIKYPYLASLIYENEVDANGVTQFLERGGCEFKRIFGFTSRSFIAPMYCWAPQLEMTFSKMGVEFIQGSNFHRDYDFTTKKFIRYHHGVGKRNTYGQFYLNRNISFEPSISGRPDAIKSCMAGISNAFLFGKPAVISSHRLNFIGQLDEENRTKNIELFRQLIVNIMKKWPEVEFVNTVQLGEIIKNEFSNKDWKDN
jgi:hypothetical protein